jgi:hypothetical protein
LISHLQLNKILKNLSIIASIIAKEFGPLAATLCLVTYLNAGFTDSIRFALKVLALSLSLIIIYEWIYIVNEFIIKKEPPELRTIRFSGEVTIKNVIVSFLARMFGSQGLLLLSIKLGILDFNEYFNGLIIVVILVFLMILHQMLDWRMRSLSTLPLLGILRVLYVFLPLTNELYDKYWILVYAFTITIPHLLNYFGSKLIRITLKTEQHHLLFNRRTFTIYEELLYMSIMFSIFLVVSFWF